MLVTVSSSGGVELASESPSVLEIGRPWCSGKGRPFVCAQRCSPAPAPEAWGQRGDLNNTIQDSQNTTNNTGERAEKTWLGVGMFEFLNPIPTLTLILVYWDTPEIHLTNNKLLWARKYARIVVRGYYLFREANSCPRAKLKGNCELRGTDNVQGQLSVHISEAKSSLFSSSSFEYFLSQRKQRRENRTKQNTKQSASTSWCLLALLSQQVS